MPLYRRPALRRPDESPTRGARNDSPREVLFDSPAHDPRDPFRPKNCLHCRSYGSGFRIDGYVCNSCIYLIKQETRRVFEMAALGYCAGSCGGNLSDNERLSHLYICRECGGGRDRHVSTQAERGTAELMLWTRLRNDHDAYTQRQFAQMIVEKCANLHCRKPMPDQDVYNHPAGPGRRFLYCPKCRNDEMEKSGNWDLAMWTIDGPRSPSELDPNVPRFRNGGPSSRAFAPGDPFGSVRQEPPAPFLQRPPVPFTRESPVPDNASEASTIRLSPDPSLSWYGVSTDASMDSSGDVAMLTNPPDQAEAPGRGLLGPTAPFINAARDRFESHIESFENATGRGARPRPDNLFFGLPDTNF
ncbi:hypothetical protein AK830_g11016 [Neonectria ditissima]|uniref:Stc1 domain-containing protein n=1 Tax=Neonectria ditissima TaxID=78410 RepID=A0A0P7B4C3_9HYPO|nr:hypothetical protein AK830_g11016 [Neonectria ditissima]